MLRGGVQSRHSFFLYCTARNIIVNIIQYFHNGFIRVLEGPWKGPEGVPANKRLLARTVPANKRLLARTVICPITSFQIKNHEIEKKAPIMQLAFQNITI